MRTRTSGMQWLGCPNCGCSQERWGNQNMCWFQNDSEPPSAGYKTFPLPTTHEVFSTLAQGESFSTLDLARGYKQMVVKPDSWACLTINTHLGLFRYKTLPFEIATAPAIWQREMSVVLQGCMGVVYYIDDILVTGRTREEHEKNLQMVFRHLQQFGLHVKMSKCQFFQDSVTYFGHKITREGVQPTQEWIRAIKEAPIPQNKTELKSFLGMLTYNVRFLLWSGCGTRGMIRHSGKQRN